MGGMTEKEITHLICFHESLDHRLTVQLLKEFVELRQQLAKARAGVTREVDRTHEHTCRIVVLENQLAAQAAELERLRERCEAATFIRYGNVIFAKQMIDPPRWYFFKEHQHYTEYMHGDWYATFNEAYQAAIAAGIVARRKQQGRELQDMKYEKRQTPSK